MNLLNTLLFTLCMIIKCYYNLVTVLMALILNTLSLLLKWGGYSLKGLSIITIKLSKLSNVEVDWNELKIKDTMVYKYFKKKDIKTIQLVSKKA